LFYVVTFFVFLALTALITRFLPVVYLALVCQIEPLTLLVRGALKETLLSQYPWVRLLMQL
jgi:hypothetical protein